MFLTLLVDYLSRQNQSNGLTCLQKHSGRLSFKCQKYFTGNFIQDFRVEALNNFVTESPTDSFDCKIS